MSASTCDFFFLFFSGSPLSLQQNREVFLRERRQRPAAVAPLQDRLTPHSSPLLSDLPGLMDTLQRLTCSNECNMSNQQCIWSGLPHQPSSLWAFSMGPSRLPWWSQEQICFVLHSHPGFSLARGSTKTPNIHQSHYIPSRNGNAAWNFIGGFIKAFCKWIPSYPQNCFFCIWLKWIYQQVCLSIFIWIGIPILHEHASNKNTHALFLVHIFCLSLMRHNKVHGS